MHALSSPPPGLAPLLAVLLTVTVVVPLAHHAFAAARFTSRPGDEHAVHLQRVLSGLAYGVVPLLAAVLAGAAPASLGLAVERPSLAAAFVPCASIVFGASVLVASRGAHFREHYPAIRGVHAWNAGLVLRNLASWTVYLLGYELMFRGVLLFTLAEALGAWPALAISTLAYVWQHLPKNAQETAATLPVGLVFGAAALSGTGFWAPFVVHVVVANLSDVLAAFTAPRTR